MLKQYMVLRFKRVKMKLKWLSYSNEYKMKLDVVLKFNRVKNESISDILGQMSQDWS